MKEIVGQGKESKTSLLFTLSAQTSALLTPVISISLLPTEISSPSSKAWS